MGYNRLPFRGRRGVPFGFEPFECGSCSDVGSFVAPVRIHPICFGPPIQIFAPIDDLATEAMPILAPDTASGSREPKSTLRLALIAPVQPFGILWR